MAGTIAIPTRGARRRALLHDAVLALVIGIVLSASWAIGDWAHLGNLNLPDTDDMMRLAQVRDWLAGQGFNDWTQYRLAPPFGGPMHWSRINDLGIAALILLFQPLVGRHGAELVAVIGYPGLLFVAYLFLAARIARRLGGAASAMPAVILSAVAFPALGLFLPGRVDHHALQIVLMLTTVLMLMRPPGLAEGLVAGVATALSFAIGLETVPQAAAAMGALFVLWTIRGDAERQRLAGFGAGLAGVTALLLAVARPTFWSPEWCDAFTPASSTAALVGGGYWLALAVVPLRAWRLRLGVGAVLGGVALAAIVHHYPVCLTGPYGPMDPFVRHALIDNILEAKGVFQSRAVGWGLPSVGVMLVASLAAAVFAWRRPQRRLVLLPVALVLLASDVVVLSQVRGAYLGSALAGAMLAQGVVAARRLTRWRLPALVAAWTLSCGVLWTLVPIAIDSRLHPQFAHAATMRTTCNTGDVWRQVDRYPTGLFFIPANEAAYLIGGTRHSSVGAGYHRVNRGNRAMYAFFLADPTRARAIAAAWHARYVAMCPNDFGELDVAHAYPASLANRLRSGQVPAWLTPLPLHGTGLALYHIVP